MEENNGKRETINNGISIQVIFVFLKGCDIFENIT